MKWERLLKRWPWAVAFFSVALVGSQVYACATKPAPPESDIPYANIWSADAGVDLFARGAELIRASHESAWLVKNGGLSRAYSGYREALVDIGNESKMEYFFTQTEKGTEGPDWVKDANENFYNHITAYSADDKTVTATVCRYVVPTKGLEKGQTQSNILTLDMSVVDIRLENSSSQPGKAGIANRDPATHDPAAHRPPGWNVFGTWKITRISRNRDFDPEGCKAWFKQQLPDLREVPESKLLKVPDSFEIPPRALAAQYPEWIRQQ